MAIEAIAPDSLPETTNLSGTLADVDEDPDSPDANWLTAVSDSSDTVARVSFGTPSESLETGAGLQEFRIQVRRTNQSTAEPTADIQLYESGSLVATIVSSITISSTTGQVISGTWDASQLSDQTGANAECRIVGTSTGSDLQTDNTVEVGAFEWNADVVSQVQTVTPGPRSVGLSFPAPSVSTTTPDVTRTPNPLSVAANVGSTLSVSYTPSPLGVTARFPTDFAETTLTPTPLGIDVTMPTATVVTSDQIISAAPLGVNVSVGKTLEVQQVAAPLSVATSMPAPSVGQGVLDQTKTPSPLSVGLVFPTAVVPGSGLTRAPSPLQVVVSVGQTLETQQVPAPLSVATSMPTVGLAQGLTASPSPLTVALKVTSSVGVTLQPDPISVASSLPEPTVDLGATNIVTPIALQVDATLPTPRLSGALTRSASPLSVSTALPAPTAKTLQFADPAPLGVALTLPDAGVSIDLPTDVTIAAGSLAVSTTIPTAVPSWQSTVAPAPLSVSASGVTPTIAGAVAVQPDSLMVQTLFPTASAVGGTQQARRRIVTIRERQNLRRRGP